MSTDTLRAALPGDTAITIAFGGVIGDKDGFVVDDQGGDTIEVRYETKKGETFKAVRADKVRTRDAHVVDDVPADDIPVRDVRDDIDDAAPAEVTPAPAARRKRTTPDTLLELDPQDVPVLTVTEVRDRAAYLATRYAPIEIVRGLRNLEIATDPDKGADLNRADRARLVRETHYQACRVLLFLEMPEDVPANYADGRERRAAGTRPARTART